jgi:hypothetical protein
VTFGFAPTLVDGNYVATLIHGSATDVPGNPLFSDAQFPFFVLAADANRDRTVNSADFAVLASHFGESGTILSHGDFNYDGQANALDFNLLASKFGAYLPPPAPDVATQMLPSALNWRPSKLFSDDGIAPTEQALVEAIC